MQTGTAMRVSYDAQGRRVLTHPEADTITRAVLVERARALVPALRERAQRTEEARQLLPETLADFERAGFFRICQPRRFGGFEMGLDVLEAVLIEAGRGCGSSAWNLGILAGHAWWASMFPEEGQVEIFGEDGHALLPGGFLGGRGVAKRVEGGYEVAGRWPYQSGCDASNWFGVSASLEDEGDGPPAGLTFVVPAADVRIEDDWFVLGMRGTGSKTVVIDQAFVPERRSLTLKSVEEQETPGSKVHANPLYHAPVMAFISIEVTGAAVGVALQAVEVLDEIARAKPVRGRAGATQMESPIMRRRLAEAKSLAETARVLLLSEASRLMRMLEEYVPQGRKLSREEIGEYGLQNARIVDLCVGAVDHAFAAAGTSATFTGHPLERCFRDIHMISTHTVLRVDNTAESWGLAHFGLGGPPATAEGR